MNCPKCRAFLRTTQYEGIQIETCDSCQGEWLDADELGKIVKIREMKFSESERLAIVRSTTITGVRLDDVDRDLPCPKCGGATDAINYGGDSGIIIDRCTQCRGFWLDDGELEKVQMLIEGWEDALPDDLAKHGQKLRDVEARLDREDDVHPSRIPVIGRFINSAINGILDLG